MPLPHHVTLVEVGPRDGLQNEPVTLPTDVKLTFIEKLSESGLTVIEPTSFVSPKWVPQMADHAELMQGLSRCAGVQYPALVPNLRGFNNALVAGATEIAVFTAASNTFTEKNTHCTLEESLRQIEQICIAAEQHGIAVRGYISCVLGCPYEGAVQLTRVADIARALMEMGCYEISLGDTIGVGTAAQAQALIETVSEVVPLSKLAIHFHDTYGQALANIYACLELGVQTIDCSVGGLGGCPFAPGAGGNVATEDVLYLLSGLGIETGVDLKKLLAADAYIHTQLNRPTRSKVARAMQSHDA